MFSRKIFWPIFDDGAELIIPRLGGARQGGVSPLGFLSPIGHTKAPTGGPIGEVRVSVRSGGPRREPRNAARTAEVATRSPHQPN
jgi:hypothetical protein